MMVDLSLIIPTISRTKELDRLLNSLLLQTFKNFEVIIVDQNIDNRAKKVCDEYEGSLNIIYITSKKGVSRARNAGARIARGQALCFPDDDCWYHSGLTEQILSMFQNKNLDGVTGKCSDPYLELDVYPYMETLQRVDYLNCTRTVSACALFVRRSFFESHDGFNEKVGPGADTVWGGMEEHELVLRYVKSGGNIVFDPSLIIYHQIGGLPLSVSKAQKYAGGQGLINAAFPKVRPGLAHGLMRSLAGCLSNLAMFRLRKAKINMAAFIGRLIGYLIARQGWRSQD